MKIVCIVDDLVDLGFILFRIFSLSLYIAVISSKAFNVLGFMMRLSKDFKLAKLL